MKNKYNDTEIITALRNERRSARAAVMRRAGFIAAECAVGVFAILLHAYAILMWLSESSLTGNY